MDWGSWFKTLSLSLLLVFFSVTLAITDPGDYAILEEFHKGLSNAELLRWPANNQDPCGNPRWDNVYCYNSRVTQIQTKTWFGRHSPIGFPQAIHAAYLDNNQFTTIPSDFFVGLDSLQVLALDKNPLNQSTGWMLPADLENSAQLLSYNNLTRGVPVNYTGLPLQILWLNNQEGGLTGSFEVFTSMTMLKDVWLHGNRFTGRIPNSISSLTSLTRLWLNDNQLVGLVPVKLTSLLKLQSLHLDDNYFMGPIPKVSFSDFTYSYNSFCQSTPGVPCPPSVGALLDFLDAVDYPLILANSWNGNDSCVGTWIGVSCTHGNTSVINLPNNHLNGTIYPSLANLNSLIQILLGRNNLSGTIPEDLTGLKFLKLLNLASNNISPPVPQFPNSVEMILNGNSLLNNGSSPSSYYISGPSNKPSSSSNLSSTVTSPTSTSSTNVVVITIPVIVVVSVLLLGISFLLRWKKGKNPFSVPRFIIVHPQNSSDPDNFVKMTVENNSNSTAVSELHSINYSQLADTHVIESGNLIISVQILHTATQNFVPENVLGRGGFGVVYKG
ncbi:hypothetical protein ZIOFF_019816 [Zingiber officinale]|uniref:Leucine-rich repeat-containing N-terminal plant-type domain-containing protein n=1 Tax=Zingiber officinale TaxID=94328 RepID=A0A8J5H7X3_ZINOF|nr:hypothetical protein ZIOFF_019816 [Zingiber officinale]